MLVVEDDPTLRGLLAEILVGAGFRVGTVGDGQAALDALDTDVFDVVLLDLQLPKVSGLNILSALPALRTDARFIVMTSFASVDSAVEAMNLGAHDYLQKPFKEADVLRRVERACEGVSVRREFTNVRSRASELGFEGMVGRSPRMRGLFATIARVGGTRATVLVHGETGTGKELVAQAIHAVSERKGRPFVPVNCSALPEALLESELFGHERGSFTGAVQSRRGWIEEAAGGTLFLDEIGTLSTNIQVKLLRVLQDRTIHRIGSRAAVRVDFRLIVATNQDLLERVRQGEFREDLFYRLNVFPVRVPPLRERREDIPLLVQHFIEKSSRELGLEAFEPDPELLARLQRYDWPGNVRELENYVERTTIQGRGAELTPFDPGDRGSDAAHRTLRRATNGPDRWTLDRLEREYILSVLEETGWQRAKAAEILGIHRRTIYRKLRQYREEGLLPVLAQSEEA